MSFLLNSYLDKKDLWNFAEYLSLYILGIFNQNWLIFWVILKS